MIRVLIADDAVAIRGIIRKNLSAESDMEVVGTSANGRLAVEDYKRLSPDILILDVEMPEMNGIEALAEILEYDRDARVIMCSALTQSGANITLEALEMGARDYLTKPSNDSLFMSPAEFNRILLEKIRALSKQQGTGTISAQRPVEAPALPSTPTLLQTDTDKDEALSLRPYPPMFHQADIIAIGSSTGGVQAILTVLESLRGRLTVPIVITQHMPPTFTSMLAVHIHRHSGLPAFEATEGMKVEKGHVYIAPGNRHLEIRNGEDGKIIHLSDAPQENYCRPSVEPMFRSLLQTYRKNILAVILTGMGQDGSISAPDLVESSNLLIAQDKKTSAVWGMPGAVARAGLCHAVLPLNNIASEILRFIPPPQGL